MGFLSWPRAVCLAACLYTGCGWAGEPALPSENEVKSAMLYNFAKFVAWPGGAFAESGAPLVIGVWNDDSMAATLDATLRHKSLSGHPVVIRRVESIPAGKECAVLLVGAADEKQIARMVHLLARSPVLTVGEQAQFAHLGGIIAFLRDGTRIRFEINVDAAERSGLQFSSNLLRLAQIWRENPAGAN